MSKTESLIAALNERILAMRQENDPDHSLRYLMAASIVAIECLAGLHGGIGASPTDGTSGPTTKGQEPPNPSKHRSEG